MRLAIPLMAALLAACGNNSSPPLPLPMPVSPWAVTAGTSLGPLMLANNESYLDLLSCTAATVCHVSYIEMPWGAALTGKASIQLTYNITGSAPVFDYHVTSDNICDSPAHVLLFIHQAGDNLSGIGVYEFYRWFDMTDQQPLSLGDHVMVAPLDPARWVSVYGKKGDDPAAVSGWAGALANPGTIGIGFGGGCFAAHGVAVTSGSARFTIQGIGVQ